MNHSGSAEIAPTERTADGVPLARAHSVRNTVVPPETMSRLPDSRPSFIGLPPANCRQLTLTLDRPAAARCFSSSWLRWIRIIGIAPMPNWVAMRSSETSARAGPAGGLRQQDRGERRGDHRLVH